MFGSVNPGFDDYTEDWGTCTVRVMERNPLLITAATDFLTASNIAGAVAITWDDWTEGTHFEPDTIQGTSMLVTLKQGFGKMAGEAADPTGDALFNSLWVNYGQARNCNGGKASIPPVINLSCTSSAVIATTSSHATSAAVSTSSHATTATVATTSAHGTTAAATSSHATSAAVSTSSHATSAAVSTSSHATTTSVTGESSPTTGDSSSITTGDSSSTTDNLSSTTKATTLLEISTAMTSYISGWVVVVGGLFAVMMSAL